METLDREVINLAFGMYIVQREQTEYHREQAKCSRPMGKGIGILEGLILNVINRLGWICVRSVREGGHCPLGGESIQ